MPQTIASSTLVEAKERRFYRTHAPVLDFANGQQKENQQEVHEVEKTSYQEEGSKETGAEAQDAKEVGETQSHSEQSNGKKQRLEENDQSEDRRCGPEDSAEKPGAACAGLLR